MTRTAYDSADWRKIPAAKDTIALLYGDGRYAVPEASRQAFADAGAQTVMITVLGDPAMGICDVERGDVTPAGARNYARGRRALGHMPTIYVSRDSLPAVRDACQGLVYDVLVADWTGMPHQVTGTVGCQYLPGPDYDTSVIYDDDWHRK